MIELTDDYDHCECTVEYILENQLMDEPAEDSADHNDYSQLAALHNSCFTVFCGCCTNTEKSSCQSIQTCLHGGNYEYHIGFNGKELRLSVNRQVKDLIYECSSLCKCRRSTCGNRLLQYGPRSDLEIVSSDRLGASHKGLVSKHDLSSGIFICEYVGEILTETKAKRRHDSNKSAKNYIVCLIERSTGSDVKVHRTFIDPTFKGNIGRYLNHSCDPNCEILSVRVDGPLPKLGIFTIRSVKKGAELCFDYAGGAFADVPQNPINRIKCNCGAMLCKGFLPNLCYNL